MQRVIKNTVEGAHDLLAIAYTTVNHKACVCLTKEIQRVLINYMVKQFIKFKFSSTD